MRDRTKARNYSAEKEEFRRDHARRRQWGLVRRHAQKLCRSHGCTGKCAEVGLHDFAEAVPPLIWPDDAIYTQRPAPAPGAPGRFIADGRDLRSGSGQQVCRPVPAGEAAAARRAGTATRAEPVPRPETAAHTAPVRGAELAGQRAEPVRGAEPAGQRAEPVRRAEPAGQQAEPAHRAGAAVPPYAEAAGHVGGPGQDEPGRRPALVRPTTSVTGRRIPAGGSAPPPTTKADLRHQPRTGRRRSTGHPDNTSLAQQKPPGKKIGTIHFGTNPRRPEKGELIARRSNVRERSPPSLSWSRDSSCRRRQQPFADLAGQSFADLAGRNHVGSRAPSRERCRNAFATVGRRDVVRDVGTGGSRDVVRDVVDIRRCP